MDVTTKKLNLIHWITELDDEITLSVSDIIKEQSIYKDWWNYISNAEKISMKSSEKILNAIQNNKLITIEELSNLLGITTRGVEKNIVKLKTKGLLERMGADKGGYWKVL